MLLYVNVSFFSFVASLYKCTQWRDWIIDKKSEKKKTTIPNPILQLKNDADEKFSISHMIFFFIRRKKKSNNSRKTIPAKQ